MANPEHLAILQQGLEAWNKWRKENPRTLPDLREARLSQRLLRAAVFDEADLYRADLGGSDLAGAKLRGAILGGANLCNADLTEAHLGGAHLGRTKLHGAVLVGAKLRGTNLYGADLSAADLTDAEVGWAVFGDQDLSETKGLGSVLNIGPSTIGIDTIYRSKGRIPEAFLRGAGVPHDFIVYMRSLVANATEFYSCFISYSSKDQQFAERLRGDLQQKGVRCWFAPENLKIGDMFQERIEESIRWYDKLLLVLSENSIQSPWVEDEVQAALERERQGTKLVLFPIRLDDAVMTAPKSWAANLRRTRHIGEFSRWEDHDSYQKAFGRLLRDLKTETPSEGAS